MTGKHHTIEPSRRPLAQKLSGLIRHSSAKGKTSPVTGTTYETSSISWFKKQKKLPSPGRALEFKPLEVDLKVLKGIRLSEGWLETETRDAPNKQRPSAPAKSTTPIGDLFVNKSVLDLPVPDQPRQSGQLDRSSSQKQTNNGKRPFSMVETQSITYGRTSVDLTSTRNIQPAGSILDRGRPVEPKHFVTDPLPKRTGSRHEVTPQVINSAIEKAITPKDLTLKTSQYSSSRDSSVVTEQNLFSQSRPAKNLETNNRHSMYAGVTTSPSTVSAIARTPLVLRSASAMPLDRIHAWQKTVPSAPTSAAAANLTSGPSSALTSGVSPQADVPVRRTSTRGVGNRLAWIRELEGKKSSSTNGDLGVLKKQAGSVSDKLAMFENKQMQSASPALRLPPVARSNSTASRLSWAGVESASSANGNITATPRTSIDTARSSHRASSVMSYYDDSFREKMESVVGGQAAEKIEKPEKTDKDSSDLKEKQQVTARFVPVKSEKAEEKLQPFLSDTDTSITVARAETLEKELQSSPQETGTSTAGLGKPEEPCSFQADVGATILESEKTNSPPSSQLEAFSPVIESEMEAKIETAPQSSLRKTVASTTESDKADDELNGSLPTATLGKSEEGLHSFQEDVSATIIEAEKTGLLPSSQVEEFSSTIEPEMGDKVETESQSPQSEANASILDPEKGEKAEEEQEAGSSGPELEKTQEKPQYSQLEVDNSTAGAEKADEELQPVQVVSDVAMTDADKEEEKSQPTQPESEYKNLPTDKALEEEKVSVQSPAAPQDSTIS
jgi:hypothetical protein